MANNAAHPGTMAAATASEKSREDGVDRGPITRAGFVATTSINRPDFDVNWNSTMDRGGIVVGKDIDITIDVEALRDSDLQRR
jgi:polyisoprenoid-binding protein YceI